MMWFTWCVIKKVVCDYRKGNIWLKFSRKETCIFAQSIFKIGNSRSVVSNSVVWSSVKTKCVRFRYLKSEIREVGYRTMRFGWVCEWIDKFLCLFNAMRLPEFYAKQKNVMAFDLVLKKPKHNLFRSEELTNMYYC